MMQTGSSVANVAKAGWWARFFALFLDGLIIGVPATVVLIIVAAAAGANDNGVLGGLALLVYVLWIIAYIAYFIYFWTKDGQTLGNRMLNIRVVREDGSPLTGGAAAVRYIGYLVDSIIFGLPIGYLWAAFDTKKQAWHDKMAGTVVVRTS